MENLKSRVPESFERQFEHREMIETAGGMAETVDISPRQQGNEVPVLLAPAWACTLPIYKPTIETIAQAGRRTLSLNHPRRGGKVELTGAEQELVKDIPEAEVRKALTLRDVLRHKNIDTIDVIAHSEGAINAGIAALLLAEEAAHQGKEPPIRNIVFFGPAGLIGEDTPLRLMQGFGAQGNPKPSLEALPDAPDVGEEEKIRTKTTGAEPIHYPEIESSEAAQEAIVGSGKVPVVMKELGKYVGGNPIRAFQEGWGMATVQIDDLIARLREHGIGVVIMSAVDDPVFSTKTMAERLKKGSVDGFLSVRGGHGQLGENPERYAVAALQMLDAVEAKKQREQSAASPE